MVIICAVPTFSGKTVTQRNLWSSITEADSSRLQVWCIACDIFPIWVRNYVDLVPVLRLPAEATEGCPLIYTQFQSYQKLLPLCIRNGKSTEILMEKQAKACSHSKHHSDRKAGTSSDMAMNRRQDRSLFQERQAWVVQVLLDHKCQLYTCISFVSAPSFTTEQPSCTANENYYSDRSNLLIKTQSSY